MGFPQLPHIAFSELEKQLRHRRQQLFLKSFQIPIFHSSFAAAVVLSQRPDDKVIPSIVVNNPENSHVASALGGFSDDTSIALDRVGGHCLRCSSVCSAGSSLIHPRVRPFRSSPDVRRRERCRGESEEGGTLTSEASRWKELQRL